MSRIHCNTSGRILGEVFVPTGTLWSDPVLGTARTYHFQTNIYSGQELKELLLRAGFGEVKLYGSLEGEEYGSGAKRLVAVANKT